MRGRKPKPTAQKKRQGNPGKRKINRREPQPKMSADIKPKLPRAVEAAIDDVAIAASCRSFTERYLPQLKAMGVYTDADQAAFELMTLHYALAWVAAETVQLDGLKCLSVKGGEMKHPLLQVVRENSNLFRAYAAEFGMTPSARSRIEIPDPNDHNQQLEMELFGWATRPQAAK
jgi:P27 family predicted phage terminase small subunit